MDSSSFQCLPLPNIYPLVPSCTSRKDECRKIYCSESTVPTASIAQSQSKCKGFIGATQEPPSVLYEIKMFIDFINSSWKQNFQDEYRERKLFKTCLFVLLKNLISNITFSTKLGFTFIIPIKKLFYKIHHRPIKGKHYRYCVYVT